MSQPPPLPPAPLPYSRDPAPRKSWWGRNWFWVVPLGCLSPIIVCGGFFATLVGILFGALRSSDVYKDAMKRANADPAVVSVLGKPVEAGWMLTGKIDLRNSDGDADISIPVHGPTAAGTIHVAATKTAGTWQFSTLDVETGGKHIDLLKKAPAASPSNSP